MKVVVITWLICVVCVNAFDFAALLRAANDIEDWVIQTRRELHKIPELKFDLPLTSAYVRKILDDYSIPYKYPIATSGVVATIGSGSGPVVGLRADMDALPIQEETSLEFASEHEGKMHACGHDAHTAMLLGAARLLKDRESSIKGQVKLVFQPAEEIGRGAKAMLKTGELDDLSVMFGFHVWPGQKTGKVFIRSGKLMAGVSKFEVTVRGKGGHASMPNLTNDPSIAVASMILAYQTIVSRRTSPLDSNVVSVTTIHGGTAFNIIPDDITFGGTLRTLQVGGIAAIKADFKEITNGIAAAYNCTADMDFSLSGEPVINDEIATTYAANIAEKTFGKDFVTETEPTMAAEDFSRYGERVSSSFIFLGSGSNDDDEVHGLHTPRFTIDEALLVRGAAFHAALALNYHSDTVAAKTEL